MKRRNILFALLLLSAIFCAACSKETVVSPTAVPAASATPEPTETPEITVTEAPVITEPVATPEATLDAKHLTPAVTSAPEITQELTLPPEPTPTPEPTEAPTLTPTPTPVPVKGIVAGDYITYGSYPQTEITGADLTDDIINAEYDEYGNTEVNGVRIKRMSYAEVYKKGLVNSFIIEKNDDDFIKKYYEKEGFCYFLWEPVEWLVLETKDGNAFLLSKYVLDAGAYDEKYDKDRDFTDRTYHYEATWEKSTIRTWLNDYFYNNVFTSYEQKNILLSDVKNPPNTLRGASSGPDTRDKVYLLSESEVIKYFGKKWVMVDKENRYIWEDGVYPEQDIQLGVPTEYATKSGANMSRGLFPWSKKCCLWGLRTIGEPDTRNQFIEEDGFLDQEGWGYVDDWSKGIRPALWLDIASADVEKVK